MTRFRFWSLLLPLLTLLGSPQNTAADWNYTFLPGISAGLEYDSNIYFTSANEESDFNYHANVTLPFRAVSPATEIGFNYRTSYFQYNSASDANYGNHFFNFDASHALTRRLRLSLSDGFSISEDADRILRRESSEGETGIIVERNKRRANAATGSMTYSLTQRMLLSLSATHSFYRYSDPRYFDSSTNRGSMSFNYSLDPKNTFFLSLHAGRNDYERSERELTQNAVYSLAGVVGFFQPLYQLFLNPEFDASDNESAFLGWTRHLSPTIELTFSAGARWTKETTNLLTLVNGTQDLVFPNPLPAGSIVQYTVEGSGTFLSPPTDASGLLTIPSAAIRTSGQSTRDSGLVYDVSLNKTFRASSLSLRFTQDTYDRSALAGTTVRQGYLTSYNHRLSDRLRAFLNASYYKNKTESDLFDDNYETARIGIGSTFRVTRHLGATLTWNHTEQKRDLGRGFTQPRTTRDLVSLVCTYQWQLER